MPEDHFAKVAAARATLRSSVPNPVVSVYGEVRLRSHFRHPIDPRKALDARKALIDVHLSLRRANAGGLAIFLADESGSKQVHDEQKRLEEVLQAAKLKLPIHQLGVLIPVVALLFTGSAKSYRDERERSLVFANHTRPITPLSRELLEVASSQMQAFGLTDWGQMGATPAAVAASALDIFAEAKVVPFYGLRPGDRNLLVMVRKGLRGQNMPYCPRSGAGG